MLVTETESDSFIHYTSAFLQLCFMKKIFIDSNQHQPSFYQQMINATPTARRHQGLQDQDITAYLTITECPYTPNKSAGLQSATKI